MKPSDAYRSAMDGLHYTPEQKEALARRLEAAQPAAPKKSRKTIYWRTALAAAALAVVFTVGAGAAGIWKAPSEIFGRVFDLDPAQTEIVDKIGYPVDACATDNGLTISVDAVMGDSSNLCIAYSLTFADGLPAGMPAPDENGRFSLGFAANLTDLGKSGSSHGQSYFLDPDPTDNQIQYIEIWSTSYRGLASSKCNAYFEDLMRYPSTGPEQAPLVAGKWNIPFRAAYEDCSVTLESHASFAWNGVSYTLQSVTISPLAVRVDYTTDKQSPQDTQTSALSIDEDSLGEADIPLTLQKTDGTVLELHLGGGTKAAHSGQIQCHKNGLLPEIIPLDEIQSITFGGVEVPLR